MRAFIFLHFLLCMHAKGNAWQEAHHTSNLSLGEAIDSTLVFLSASGNPSNNTFCVQNIRELMIRNSIHPSIDYLRNNITDAQLLRLGMLASIALISPWKQNAEGKFIITDRGILVDEYHPSSSESDIMLCVVCTLLAIIVLFHVTSAQHHYVVAPAPPPDTGTKK